jgi:transcriptional regulator with PAS, ATPase and Fis domain
LPDLDAEELMEIIRRRFPGIQVVLVDSDKGQAFESPEELSETNHHGEDFTPPRLRDTVPVPAPKPLPGMIGGSAGMARTYRLARLIAPHNTTVLIVGPSGSGKELVARGIHRLSARAMKPFIVVNCAAIPETLLESELFGYSRGAFTGALQSQSGRIQAASGGTLFLDEIGDLPLFMQPKLLRFLERKEVQRLGSAETTQVDVRVIAATNAELAKRVEQGTFREDLYYRLAAFPIELEPLAAHTEDVIPLAEHFLSAAASSLGVVAPGLSDKTEARLRAHAWRGNVRELQHVIERAVILAEGSDIILPEHLSFPFEMTPPDRSRVCTFMGKRS